MEKQSRYQKQRQNMLKVIEQEARLTQSYTGKSCFDRHIMKAMGEVPRHEFIPESARAFAYDNGPVYIGHGQTISQPYIVALMTDLIAPKPEHKVLDVGTGSGFQAAILSRLVSQVYSVEIVSTLAERAQQRLDALGYDNIHIKVDDGYAGWPENSPYNGIIVAAASPIIPLALVEQLKPGGTLVLPLGHPYQAQELVVVKKNLQGDIRFQEVLPVSFVPMLGKSETLENENN